MNTHINQDTKILIEVVLSGKNQGFFSFGLYFINIDLRFVIAFDFVFNATVTISYDHNNNKQ